MKKVKHIGLSGLVIGLLAGCGGGGDSSAPTPDTLTFTIAEPSIVVQENGTATVSVNAVHSGNAALSYAIDSLPAGVTFTVNNSQLTLSASELTMASYQDAYTVTASAGDLEQSAILTISLVNTSGDSLAKEADMLITGMDNIEADGEVVQLKNFYQQAAYLTGEALAQSSFIAAASIASLDLDALANARTQFLMQRITQAELEQSVQDAITAVENTVSAQVAGMKVATLPVVPDLTLTLDPVTGTWSFFEGNADFGQLVDNQWQYTGDFAFLNTLFDSTINVCMNTNI